MAEQVASPEARLVLLGLTLPAPATPLASYVPTVRYGNLVQTAGQLPLADGAPVATGLLGEDVSVEDGAAAARVATLGALAAVRAAVGSLDAVARVIKVMGFVAATPGFTDHPKVVNGASDLIGEIFGDAGRHARSAVGVASLPLGVPVEIEMLVEVVPGA